MPSCCGEDPRRNRRDLATRSVHDAEERRHVRKVRLMLTALSFVRATRLRADQGLRRADAFGGVRYIQVVMLDLLVQMLAAIFVYPETMGLLGRIKSKGLQFTTVIAPAGNLHILLPVLWRFGRIL